MLWPERPDNWREFAASAERAFATVASAIARNQPVTMGVSAQQFALARKTLPAGVRAIVRLPRGVFNDETDGTGSEVIQRIAAPMVGGMITAPLLSLFVIPAAYRLLRQRGLRHAS